MTITDSPTDMSEFEDAATAGPLASLTFTEIETIRDIVTASDVFTETTRFAYVGLEEPHKLDVLAFRAVGQRAFPRLERDHRRDRLCQRARLPCPRSSLTMSHPPAEAPHRLRVGDTFPRLTLAGAIGGDVTLPPAHGYVHLQLRRFAGCMVCNVHLRQVVRRLPELQSAGVKEVIVFHSTRQEVTRYEGELPLTVVADPKKDLYRRFGVQRSTMALLGAWRTLPSALAGAAVTAVRTRQLPPLSPTGGELGRPADILIGSTGRVIAVKYGTHAADQWSVDELLRIVASDSDAS